LLGFPLGKRALQEGGIMRASTFRGIVSRVLDSYLQVDAAVHPGNSGGPLIDGQGHLHGVVVGMQVAEDGVGSSAMGFVIPIAHAISIWPPPAPKEPERGEVDPSDTKSPAAGEPGVASQRSPNHTK
jgi:S1-C subfamily serine protease